MKRRVFVRNLALTGVGIGSTGLYACSTSGSAKNSDNPANESNSGENLFFKLSLAQWSIHRMIQDEGLDPYEFAAKAKGWGFEGLEYVNGLYQSKLDKSSSLNSGLQTIVTELNKRKNDNGIENLIMMVDLPSEGDMAILDASKRNKAIEMHYPWVDATAGLGCHSMRINMFGEFAEDDWKKASVDALGELGEYAASNDVNIIVENHGWLTSNAALLMEVINEVGLSNVGTLPDFGNFCTKRKKKERWGECEEEYDKYKGIEELMPAAKAVSAKSYDFDENGQTSIDYVRMLQIVKNAGYSGYIGVEYEGDNLSEEAGILATKKLLIDSAKKVS